MVQWVGETFNCLFGTIARKSLGREKFRAAAMYVPRSKDNLSKIENALNLLRC